MYRVFLERYMDLLDEETFPRKEGPRFIHSEPLWLGGNPRRLVKTISRGKLACHGGNRIGSWKKGAIKITPTMSKSDFLRLSNLPARPVMSSKLHKLLADHYRRSGTNLPKYYTVNVKTV